ARQDRKRIVMLRILQQRPDYIDLHTRQERIAIPRRLEQEYPVAPLPHRLAGQLRAIAHHQVAMTFVLGGRESYRVRTEFIHSDPPGLSRRVARPPRGG